MRIVKLIIISVLVLFFIVTIISFFIPSDIRLSRAVQINSSKALVMEQIRDPEKWRNWYPGADSSRFFYENGQIKGLILDENNNQRIAITGVKEHEVTALYTLRNKKVSTCWQIAANIDSSAVTVVWYLDFHLQWYPWEKFTSFMFERIYNPQLQRGLDNLKGLIEK